MRQGSGASFGTVCGTCLSAVIVAVFFGAIGAGARAADLPQMPDRPAILTVDEKSGLLYVFGQDNGEILVVDPQKGMAPVFGTKLFDMPADALYDPAQNKIYELQNLLGILTVMDAGEIASGGTRAAPRIYYLPDGEKGAERSMMALDAGRSRLWIAYTNFNAQALYLFDTRRETVQKITTLENPAASVVVDPGTGDLFLRHAAADFITRIDGDTHESEEVAMPGIAGEMYLDRTGRTLWAPEPYSGGLVVYSLVSGSVREIPLGVSASMLVGIPSQNRIFAVSRFGKPNVSIINAASGGLVRTVELASAPFAVFAADNLGLVGVVTADNKLLALNASGSIVGEVELPPMHALGNLWEWRRLPLAYDRIRSAVYVASPQLNALAKIDLKTFESEFYNWPPAPLEQTDDSNTVAAVRPGRDFMAPERILSVDDKIFVANYGGLITAFDNRLYRTLARITPAPTINSMVFDGDKIYVSSAYAKKIYRIDPDTYETEQEYSLPGLPAAFWHLVAAGEDRVLVADIWSGKFAFLDVASGGVEFEGAAGAGVVWAGYNPRSREAVFVTRERGVVRANPVNGLVEEIAPLGNMPDTGPYFVNTDLARTDLLYISYFDGSDQRIVGVNTVTGAKVGEFSAAGIPRTRYEILEDIVFDPVNGRVFVSFPGRLVVAAASGEILRDYLFDGYGTKVLDAGGKRGGPMRISRFWNGRSYDIYLNMGTKIMRVDPATYDVSPPLETRKDESEGRQAIGLLGAARRIMPDPERNKLYIIYNYDGMAVYDFATARVWLRANPGHTGLSWAAYHIVSPLAPGDKPQPDIPPWVARERNLRVAAALLGGLLFSAVAYALWSAFMKRRKPA